MALQTFIFIFVGKVVLTHHGAYRTFCRIECHPRFTTGRVWRSTGPVQRCVAEIQNRIIYCSSTSKISEIHSTSGSLINTKTINNPEASNVQKKISNWFIEQQCPANSHKHLVLDQTCHLDQTYRFAVGMYCYVCIVMFRLDILVSLGLHIVQYINLHQSALDNERTHVNV